MTVSITMACVNHALAKVVHASTCAHAGMILSTGWRANPFRLQCVQRKIKRPVMACRAGKRGDRLAYSLNDMYRPLRTVMRVNGSVVGLALGIVLFIFPQDLMAGWSLYAVGPIWPARLAGAALIAFGIFMWLAARERIVSVPSMVAMGVTNSLAAIALLAAYLQKEFAAPSLLGQLLLVAVFAICLIGAVWPLRYLRVEYETR